MKLIAETAWHHQGDFEFMKNLVNSIGNQSKADIIKLHLTFSLEEYMHYDHTAFKMLEDWLFTENQWKEIIQSPALTSKSLMLLMNDTRAVEFGMGYAPDLVEIHSVCLNDINLLRSFKQNINKQTKVVLGIGGTSLEEVENAVKILDHSNIILMFGFQNYPTKYENINFKKMRKIMRMFPEYKFGYADHTAWDEADNVLITLLGAALGMDYVEKHVSIVYGEERTDSAAAVSIGMLNDIKCKMNILDACNGNGLLRMNKGEIEYSIFGPMKKAAIFKQNVQAGQILELDMFNFKRTIQKSNLSQIQALDSIGRKLIEDVSKGQVLLQKHFGEK